MNRRMERHYELDNSSNNKRVLRNQDLYKTIYEDIEYTNVEGITSIGRTKDINISQIQDLLKSREEYKRERESDIKIDRHLLEIPEEEEKNYDIKDIISRAKDERVEVDNKKRSLENEKYNILKKLDATKNKTYESFFPQISDIRFLQGKMQISPIFAAGGMKIQIRNRIHGDHRRT